MRTIVDMTVTLKQVLFLVIVYVFCSCATSRSTHKESNIIITETGIEAIGTGMSQNEKKKHYDSGSWSYLR